MFLCIEIPESNSTGIMQEMKDIISKLRDSTFTQVSPRQLLVSNTL